MAELVNESNIERLRAGYEAAATGNVEFVLGLMDSEVRLHDRPEAPDATTYRGHEGVIEAMFAPRTMTLNPYAQSKLHGAGRSATAVGELWR